jgi:hypothetical protein
MPGGHPGDVALSHLAHELEERFGIHHTTIQIELADSEIRALTPEHVSPLPHRGERTTLKTGSENGQGSFFGVPKPLIRLRALPSGCLSRCAGKEPNIAAFPSALSFWEVRVRRMG